MHKIHTMSSIYIYMTFKHSFTFKNLNQSFSLQTGFHIKLVDLLINESKESRIGSKTTSDLR